MQVYSTAMCYIEFDGASKGNPGQADAGATIQAYDGRTWRLREGLGVTTNNVAECQGLLLGMRSAFLKGFEVIEASGDSLLVCNQVCDSLLDCYYLLFGKNIYDSESRAKFGYDLLIPSEVSGFVWSKALET